MAIHGNVLIDNIDIMAAGCAMAIYKTHCTATRVHHHNAKLSSSSFTTMRCNAVQGRLLQLRLPCEVRPDSSKAERSTATGHLLVTMPKEDASSCGGLLPYAR